MTTPLLLPDAKGMAIELLSGALDGVLVTSSTPPEPQFTQSLPLVRVLRVGGVADVKGWSAPAVRDRPRLSVDCYAAGEAAAAQLVSQVRAAWAVLAGQSTAVGAVTGTWEETGPQDRPEEPNTGVSRVGMILGMSVRPPRQTS